MGFYELTGQEELGVYLLLWLEMYKDRLARNTYNGYRVNICKHIIPYLGAVKLRELRPIRIQQLYARLREDGLSGTSCVYIHNTLRKALGTAVRLELLDRNPAQLVEPPRKERFQIVPLNLGQVLVLVKAAQEYREPTVGMAVLLALLLGLRRGEVLGLRWSDFDAARQLVHIARTVTPNRHAPAGYDVSDVKTANSNRTLLLADELCGLLRDFRCTYYEVNQEGYLLWRMGRLLCPGCLSYHYDKLLGGAGLPHIRFHDLRHTNATMMLQSNIPAKIVSSMLGHSGIGITLDTYTHVMTDMQRPAVEVVQGLLLKTHPGK